MQLNCWTRICRTDNMLKMTRNTILFFAVAIAAVSPFAAAAQPEAVKKAAKAVLSLTTYDVAGNVVANSFGAFVSPDGQAVAPWKPFVGAAKAVVADTDGNEYEVSALMGADELYDICRIATDRKPAAYAPPCDQPAEAGDKLWAMGFSIKKQKGEQVEVERVESFHGGYAYYVLAGNSTKKEEGRPLFTADGRLVGLMQYSSGGTQPHSTDASYPGSFRLTGLSINDAVLRQSGIRVALPPDGDDARLTLMIAQQGDSARYAAYVDDFIKAFPGMADGYQEKAKLLMAVGNCVEAAALMEECIAKADNKDEAHSAYASLILQTAGRDSVCGELTLRRALAEAEAAYAAKPLPSYLHQKAQVLFAVGSYGEAHDLLLGLSQGELRSGEVFYEVSQCRAKLGKPLEQILEMLDSAVVSSQGQSAAPYVLERGRHLDEAGLHRQAVADYNKYDTLMLGRASHAFYFTKYQCEMKLRQYQQALNDIAHAIVLNRAEPTYYACMASLQLKVNRLEDAVKTADMCIAVAPGYSDPYIIKGVALGELGQKDEALQALRHAKEIGDDRAADLIEKYKP